MILKSLFSLYKLRCKHNCIVCQLLSGDLNIPLVCITFPSPQGLYEAGGGVHIHVYKLTQNRLGAKLLAALLGGSGGLLPKKILQF